MIDGITGPQTLFGQQKLDQELTTGVTNMIDSARNYDNQGTITLSPTGLWMIIGPD